MVISDFLDPSAWRDAGGSLVMMRPFPGMDAWGNTAQNLAEEDALRLLLSYSECLPGSKGPKTKPADRMLHAYVQGNKLGAFNVRYDSLLQEQVEAGQHRHVNGEDFYDMWASFAVPTPAGSAPRRAAPPGPRRAWCTGGGSARRSS